MTIGLDIAKAHVDWHRSDTGRHGQVPNTAAGWKRLCGLAAGSADLKVVLESTGGYERGVMVALVEAGARVYLVNPRQVRDFARATGRLAKTDTLDAAVIAAFGEAIVDDSWPMQTMVDTTARDLLDRRRQLVDMRVQESNRLETAREAARASIHQHLQWIDSQIEDIEKQLSTTLHKDTALEARINLLASVPGIGPVTARTLALHMPELGRIDRREAAALAGLAPFNRDSGAGRGRRHIAHGRAEVRRVLYMAAVTAVVHNPVLADLRQRLLQAGKPGKVIIIAVARRLLVIANAMVRDGKPWQKSPQVT